MVHSRYIPYELVVSILETFNGYESGKRNKMYGLIARNIEFISSILKYILGIGQDIFIVL